MRGVNWKCPIGNICASLPHLYLCLFSPPHFPVCRIPQRDFYRRRYVLHCWKTLPHFPPERWQQQCCCSLPPSSQADFTARYSALQVSFRTWPGCSISAKKIQVQNIGVCWIMLLHHSVPADSLPDGRGYSSGCRHTLSQDVSREVFSPAGCFRHW